TQARQPNRDAWSLERLISERSILLGMALDLSTTRAYSSHLNSYLTFCNLHRLPVEPTPDTLSFFVTFMSHHILPRSVESYLSGIVSQLEPHFPQVKLARQSRLVKRTLQGAHRRFGRPVSRKSPLMRDDLLRAYLALSHPLTFDDLLWITQLVSGFYGLLRLGELTWSDAIGLRDYDKLTRRSSVGISELNFSFWLQRDKTDSRFEGNHVFIQRSLDALDPLSFFRRYLSARDGRFPLHPLLWLRADGTSPTRRWFMQRLRAFFPPDISGHSMRAGGATSLAAAGVPP
ncbi:hypothetical protein P692DRAFT_20692316, partial [Suillus brevipes Sb2]